MAFNNKGVVKPLYSGDTINIPSVDECESDVPGHFENQSEIQRRSEIDAMGKSVSKRTQILPSYNRHGRAAEIGNTYHNPLVVI